MGNVVNRSTLAYQRSVNDPDYPDPPWMSVPPGSDNETVVLSVPQRYLKIDGDVLSEMDQSEKDAVDAAAREAQRDAAVAQLDQIEDVLRAVLALIRDELNAQAAHNNAILDAVDAAVSLADFKARIALIADYPERTEQQVRTAIRNKMGT